MPAGLLAGRDVRRDVGDPDAEAVIRQERGLVARDQLELDRVARGEAVGVPGQLELDRAALLRVHPIDAEVDQPLATTEDVPQPGVELAEGLALLDRRLDPGEPRQGDSRRGPG